jgi:hypothetical protein
MKSNIFTFLLLLLCATGFAQINIAYWDFNVGSNADLNNAWPNPIPVTTGTGTLTHNFTKTEDFGGSTLDIAGFPAVAAGFSFCPVDFANNGNSLILNAATTGFKNIILSYATRYTATGFKTQTIDYSIDGINFINKTLIDLANDNVNTFVLKTIDFSGDAGVANNPNFKIKITVAGASNASGNNRFDNIRLSGAALAKSISIASGLNAAEPNTNGTFTINFVPATTNNTTFDYTLNGTATFSTDYGVSLSAGNPPNLIAANGTITVPPGTANITATLAPADDVLPEGLENINFTLSNPSDGYIINIANANINLLDDELPPTSYSFDFQACNGQLSDGFTAFSVTGPQVWACTTFGHDGNDPNGKLNTPSAVQMNGFANGTNVLNEDWLISPSLNLTGFNFPLLSFFSRTKFNGSPLELKISTDYPGNGNPNLSTWTTLNGKFPNQTSDTWTLSENINLFGFKQNNVFLAWVYNSTNDDGARWTVDDIKIDNSLVPPPPALSVSTTDISFGFTASNSTTTKTFKVTGNDLTEDIILNATANFSLSKDNIIFNNNIVLDKAIVNNIPQTIFVKFAPLAPDLNYTGSVAVSTSGINKVVTLAGTSIDPAKTLEIVNWNMEWFGSTTLGPSNDAQQEANIKTITGNIGADLFAVVEVIDEARLQNVVNNLNTIYGPGTYNYVICNYGSHVNPFEANPGPITEAQKEAFIYKPSIFSNITTGALLSVGVNTAPDLVNPDYNNWSSGRYPFMMKADVNLNGIIKTVRFVLIHAKANTSPTLTSYTRRKNGAISLHNYFNTNFPNDNIIMLGDFNDDLDVTITDGINPATTSYSSFTDDGANYFSPTLALSLANKKSTVGYNDVIDHVMLSSEMKPFYLSGSATILTDAADLVSNYGTTTTDHYPVFSRYAFDPVLLPVTLLTFTATKDGNAVKLNWATTQEINSKNFVVEKSSDGINWVAITTINATGNSNVQTNYSFTDNNPVKGINFYRLKQVDVDNHFKYSFIRSVLFNVAQKILVTPNPAKDYINVYVTKNNAADKVTVQVTDVNGRVLNNTSTTQSLVQINTNSFAKGVYMVKVINAGQVVTEKILIQ